MGEGEEGRESRGEGTGAGDEESGERLKLRGGATKYRRRGKGGQSLEGMKQREKREDLSGTKWVMKGQI